MQTFLPYQDFIKSAACLDRQRLGKQRVEVIQILNTLTGKSKGWRNHPNVKMWQGYELALATYGLEICTEWIKRGYKDTCMNKIIDIMDEAGIDFLPCKAEMPEWLNEEFCAKHRQILLEKNFEFYSKKFDIC